MEKENKQPQANTQPPVIAKPVEQMKKEAQPQPEPQMAPVKENVLVEVNHVNIDAKPTQLAVKQHSRVRFSDVFEQKQGMQLPEIFV